MFSNSEQCTLTLNICKNIYMKILIDIGHPAHVHYCRNFIKIMQARGHEFLIIARDKEIEHSLLESYKIPFVGRGSGKKGRGARVLYYLHSIFILYKNSIKFNPDILMHTHFAAIVAGLIGKPHISLADTEVAKTSGLLLKIFSKAIITPSCFLANLGAKQIRVNSFLELSYLHSNYFTPDPSILQLLKVKGNEKYIILRFVFWNASHDIGQTGLNLETKRKIVKELSKKAKVFISSESELPEDFKKYQIKIPPERIHDALAYASIFVGEGATMASECAMLGTPAIYINSLSAGTLEEQERLNLLFGFRTIDGVIDKITELLKIKNSKDTFKLARDNMMINQIDPTAFMVWFIENYPDSKQIMQNNPEYQMRFK